MKITLLPLAATAMIALTACEVDAGPGLPDGSNGPTTALVNQTAGVSAYPGAGNSDVVPDGLDTRTTFAADATLEEVYEHFYGELTAQGWQRTNLERDDDEIEADYLREGRELELELERDDGAFELEIDIDRDNSVYDQDDNDDD